MLSARAASSGRSRAARRRGASSLPATLPPGAVEVPSNFDLFWQALGVIRDNYVGLADVTDTDITYGAIRGMVDALGDTAHSVFLTPKELESEQNALDGSVVGIGVLLGERDGHIVALSIVSGSPAQAAGLKAGDIFIAVDGQDSQALSAEDLAAKVRGDEGTQVSVTVTRPSTGEQLDFSIVRARIRIPAASWTMVPGTSIGLLRLAQFSAGSADELKTARDAAIAAGATSLILDLRGNPGGYVDQAVQVASLFLHDRVVYIRETANGERTPVQTTNDVEATDLPLVILVDANTASSAEIVSGALRSAQRGRLVGQTTFGTGTVLLSFPLADGSAMRLAVERWLTPDGELIFGKGIQPTDPVELAANEVPIEPDSLRDVAPDQLATISDRQLLRAIELARQ